MSLVTVLQASLAFPDRQVFQEIGLQVEPGDRIGLVGPNGAGKTSLLRLIMGEIQPDSGEIRVKKGTRIGYLPQDIHQALSGLLLPSVLASIPGRERLENDRKRIETALSRAPHEAEQTRLAGRLAEVQQDISHLDMEFPLHQAQKILEGLGFKASGFSTPVASLSGGWKMRAVLAGLLYQRPDLLLLDEPTNHLDIPSVQWLERYLGGFKGAMVLVSHDRDFLNRQTLRTISFQAGGIRFYHGNYDDYLKAAEEEKKDLEAKARNQEQKVKEAQRFIERFRAKASKARQAQSKIKLVKKLELVQTRPKEKTIHFSFPDVPRSGRRVLSIRGVSKGFDGRPLYQGLDLTVLREERIAVIGPNGCGKTTLLKMVAGELDPDDGEIRLGHGVTLGYFAQHHAETLDPHKTVIQEVYQLVPHETIGFIRGVCGAFLFSGSQVDKPTGVLSGGEKARVSLAKLLVRPGNFMVMDEPTNHLDILSSETLIHALTQYQGTMLFVSHNQSFINKLATRIWDIRGGEIIDYPGNLDEYSDHLGRREPGPGEIRSKTETVPEGRPLAAEKPNRGEETRQDRKALKRARAENRRKVQDTLKPILEAIARLEDGIAGLESRQRVLEKRLEDPALFEDKGQSVSLINEYHEVRRELDALLVKWEDGQRQLEFTKSDLGIH